MSSYYAVSTWRDGELSCVCGQFSAARSTPEQLPDEQKKPVGRTGREAHRAARNGAPAAKGGKATSTFQRGIQALAQYIAREGPIACPRPQAGRPAHARGHRSGVGPGHGQELRAALKEPCLAQLLSQDASGTHRRIKDLGRVGSGRPCGARPPPQVHRCLCELVRQPHRRTAPKASLKQTRLTARGQGGGKSAAPAEQGGAAPAGHRPERSRPVEDEPRSAPRRRRPGPAEPGDASASLDASRTYRVQVWTRDRTDSRERFDVAMQCEEGDAGEWVEAYVIVFIHVMPYASAAERPAAGAVATS